MRVRFLAECRRAPAEYLGARLELGMDLQPDDGFVFHDDFLFTFWIEATMLPS
jgi:hypothetical protein